MTVGSVGDGKIRRLLALEPWRVRKRKVGHRKAILLDENLVGRVLKLDFPTKTRRLNDHTELALVAPLVDVDAATDDNRRAFGLVNLDVAHVVGLGKGHGLCSQ